MGRPSNRAARRAEFLQAFAAELAAHGYAGATIAAVADRAGVAPGLLHHHFASKQEMLEALLADLVARFRARVAHYGQPGEGAREGPGQSDGVGAYVDAALKLDDRADVTAARCWVGLFAEALRSPSLFRQVRRLIDSEIGVIQRRSAHVLSEREASAVLAFVIGALVVGAFAPRKTAGFAAPAARAFVASLLGRSRAR